ncbi:hypothetical protein CAL12_14125 [Bordetella genomosp. 8]|uniref:UspA domain-containing protein n=1 Tax=Bordetella genomosp. 8 TaxID=1416806 RepID=A0A1W6YLD7_9BORD|nr:universal stress protein [Bordetella genomosp. 8]ARP81841.1 hypothetical protein CAL12_14125 [Bordetella genomosp. 8]
MSCVLIPIDGSDNALRALNHVVQHKKMYEPLNVQIPIISGSVRQHKCDQIVMGSRGLGTTAGLWLGSVTTKTLHLAQVPVTIVK